MDNLSRGIDRCCTRNEDVRPIGVSDPRSALEGHAISARRTKSVRSLQVADLVLRYVQRGIGIHADDVQPMSAGSLDPRAGDVMRLGGEPLDFEQRTTRV